MFEFFFPKSKPVENKKSKKSKKSKKRRKSVGKGRNFKKQSFKKKTSSYNRIINRLSKKKSKGAVLRKKHKKPRSISLQRANISRLAI